MAASWSQKKLGECMDLEFVFRSVWIASGGLHIFTFSSDDLYPVL